MHVCAVLVSEFVTIATCVKKRVRSIYVLAAHEVACKWLARIDMHCVLLSIKFVAKCRHRRPTRS